jgi:general nucleoside transport system ATP-binding protein
LSAAESRAPLLEALEIVKRFGSVIANDVQQFDVRSGEVHALLGENGAGKSTLCKILYGYYRPDSGEIRSEGNKVSIASPRDARALGIGMVFQTFTLIPAMSVLENICLFLRDLPFILKRNEIAERIADYAMRFGFDVKLDAAACRLSAGEQQQVEILKHLLSGARILILDEPTKVLTPQESRGLFKSMIALKASGYAVVFISHKLAEVLACADRITIMRHGRIAGRLKVEDATEAKLLALMFEDTAVLRVPEHRGHERVPDQTPVLELIAVSTSESPGSIPLRDVSLKVHFGEIVGIAGISGNGQRELSDLILGLSTAVHGVKLMWGEDAGGWSVAKIRAHGAGYVADDPLTFSLVGALSVRENFALGSGKKYHNRFAIDWAKLESEMKAAFARFRLPMPPLGVRASNLSGGNLQRLVLARELSRNPNLIILQYPSRGLDVQGTAAIRDVLLDLKSKGAAILVVSEELDELFGLSDRIVVINASRLVAEFGPDQYQSEAIGTWMVRMPGQHHVA